MSRTRRNEPRLTENREMDENTPKKKKKWVVELTWQHTHTHMQAVALTGNDLHVVAEVFARGVICEWEIKPDAANTF